MTVYYVRVGGNDGNDGLSASLAHAWLTIDHAANVVAAGDTVYIGAGVYRETVTMDTSGSAGSQISFIGDFLGTYTGDAGLVVVSGWNEDGADWLAPTRDSALDLNQKQFIVWKDVTFLGGTAHGVTCTNLSVDTCFEGVEFHRCPMHAGHGNGYAMRLYMNAGATPVTAGLLLNQCFLLGGIYITAANQAGAHVDAKTVLSSCLGLAGAAASSVSALLNIVVGSTASAYSIGGFTLKSCTALGFYNGLVAHNYNKNTTNKSYMLDCLIYGAYQADNIGLGTTGAWEAHNTVLASIQYTHGAATTVVNCREAPVMLAGFDDPQYRYYGGWSPRPAFAPFSLPGWLAPGLNLATGEEASTDLYGNTLSLNLLAGSLWYGYIDGSDVAPSDPDSKWTSEANVADASLITNGYTSTAGTALVN